MIAPHRFSRATICLAGLVTLLGCTKTQRDQVPANTAPPTALARGPVEYPRARWRLAPPGQLARVGLWFSHVLIRDQDHCMKQAPFAPGGWEPLDAGCGRTRDEALKLVGALREELRTRPAEFARLARTYSEDVVTKEFGGVAGGSTAFELSAWPELLDALSVLKPGEISGVVETQFGFHLIRRDAVPDDVALSAKRIVISYSAAPWLDAFRRWTLPQRTRAEALDLARGVAQRASARPGDFDQFVERYSEHADAARLGDIGVWSSREPSPTPLELHVLAGLGEGEVSAPIDTRFGFTILKRIAVESREQFAAEEIRLRFARGLADGDKDSRASVLKTAQSIASALRKDPGAFASYQKRYCCLEPKRWSAGREPYEGARIIEQQPIGAIAQEPVEADLAFVIARRLDHTTLPPAEPPVFELPNSPRVDLDYLVEHATPHVLAKYTGVIRDRAAEALSLPDDQRARFRQIHDDLERAFGAADQPDARVAALHTAFGHLESTLGSNAFERYTTLVNELLADAVMAQR